MLIPLAAGLYHYWDRVKPYIPARLNQILSQLASNTQNQIMQFQSLVLLFCGLYMFPFDWMGLQINYLFWNGAIWTCIMSSALTIGANNGPPPIKAGWQECKVYLAKISQAAEFQWFFFAIIFVGANPFFGVLLILARRSFFIVFKAAQKQTAVLSKHPQWETIRPLFETMSAKESDILLKATVAEIALGFYLILMLLTPERQLVTTFIYWNFLRMRFQTPRTRKNQDEAWALVHQKTDPIVSKIPGSGKILDMAKNYFKGEF